MRKVINKRGDRPCGVGMKDGSGVETVRAGLPQ